MSAGRGRVQVRPREGARGLAGEVELRGEVAVLVEEGRYEVESSERPLFAQLLCRAVTVRRDPEQNGSSGPAGSWVYRS